MSSEKQADLLSLSLDVWRKAQVVIDGSPWDGYPLESKMVQDIVEEFPKYRERVVDALLDRSQLVVAYSLLVLRNANDPVLKSLPNKLLSRCEKITIRTGSFSNKMELGAFARQLAKSAEVAKTSH